MLADMLSRNGIGAAEEHLNPRFQSKNGVWKPADVLSRARLDTPGEYFGSKVMIHWLEDLKSQARTPAATDSQLLTDLFGGGFTMIHLYRQDSVAAAVSLTLARLTRQWHVKSHYTTEEVVLPKWDVLNHLISENVTWIDWCKRRLRMVASPRAHDVVEMRYEELEREPLAELTRAATAIMGEAASGRALTATTELVKQRHSESDELRERWLSQHPFYEIM